MRRGVAVVVCVLAIACSAGDFNVAAPGTDDSSVPTIDAASDAPPSDTSSIDGAVPDVRADVDGGDACSGAGCDAGCATGPDGGCLPSCATIGCGFPDGKGGTCGDGSGCLIVQVQHAKWAALDPIFGCGPSNWLDASVSCSDAANYYCRKLGWMTGWGMVDGTDEEATLVCAGPPVKFFAPAAVSTFTTDTACTSKLSGWECLIASDAFCRGKTFADGFGFIGADTITNIASLACFPGRVVTTATLTPGTAVTTGCDLADPAQRRLGRCLRAAHRKCTAKGLTTGIGPYELGSGGDYRIACLSDR
jgi:hypothetical protein